MSPFSFGYCLWALSVVCFSIFLIFSKNQLLVLLIICIVQTGLIFKIYKELKKLTTGKTKQNKTKQNKTKQNKKLMEKCGKDLKSILNKGISNGQEALKEMFKFLSDQGNAHQNDPEIIYYTN